MQDSSQNVIIKTLPVSSERLPLFIVGDIHGCSHELENLIELAKKHVSQFQLVLIGDLFTKGPDPVGVFKLIQKHSALCIKGNHDWALWSIIRNEKKRKNSPVAEHTKQTLHLIRHYKRSIYSFLCSLPHVCVTKITPQFTRKQWEAEYPLVIVHAGIDPIKGLQGTSERMLLTARYLKWDIKDGEKKLVIVPTGYRYEAAKVEQKSSDDLNSNDSQNALMNQHFRWHELYTGPELIVFGHDAKQGLFRKTLPSGRPICVGIDTGCTYGNSLTGYFPEIDLAVQVRSQRKYFDSKNNIILLKPDHH